MKIKENRYGRKEFRVQLLQTFYHLFSAILVYGVCPIDSLHNPLASDTERILYGNETHDFGINLVYFSAAMYNTLLYFWDPLTNRKVLAHHIVCLLAIPALLFNNQILYAILCMCVMYLIDLSTTLIQYKYAPHFDKRRFFVALIKIHHMVTLLLIGISWMKNFVNVGVCVLFIHDVSDVSMFALRIIHKNKSGLSQIVVSACCVLITWGYYRIFMMGTIIHDAIVAMGTTPSEFVVHGWICISSLFVLFMLNVYWTCLVIFKIFRSLAEGKIVKDTEDE